MTSNLAELQDLADVLEDADFHCEILTLGRFPRVLVGENPYCVLAILDVSLHDDLIRVVSDAQAELTQLSLRSRPASIRWDLYVLLHIRAEGGAVQPELIESIESDTKYARKFVRVDIKRDRSSVDRALRPFLPIRPAASIEPADPMELLRAGLISHGLDADLADTALASFSATGSVKLS